jgi:hypothetical protein
MLISVDHRLLEPMHATLGEPRLQGHLPDTGLGLVTKDVENELAFGPKSHGGRSSVG